MPPGRDFQSNGATWKIEDAFCQGQISDIVTWKLDDAICRGKVLTSPLDTFRMSSNSGFAAAFFFFLIPFLFDLCVRFECDASSVCVYLCVCVCVCVCVCMCVYVFTCLCVFEFVFVLSIYLSVNVSALVLQNHLSIPPKLT